LHIYQQLEGDEEEEEEEEELNPLKCKASTTTETELVQHNNNKQTNKQTTKTHKNCIKHCNNHTNNQHPMSITTSKPKLLTAICNCCCTQNHQPLPFLLLPSLRENITYYPPPKRKKKHSSNNKYNNNTQKQKTKEKGIFLPPQSAEIPQVERRNKAQRGTLDLFI
jgi:hypothetical protein